MKSESFEKRDSLLKVIAIYAVLVLMCVVTVYPMLNVLSIALRPGSRLFRSTLEIIPPDATLENFKRVFTELSYLTWLKNSLIVGVWTTMVGVLVSAFAGYAFSRYKFAGKRHIMTGFLLTQIFPAPMLLLPTYILLTRFKLMNSYIGLIIPYLAAAIPFCAWTAKGFFDSIPFSLEESAYIDGAGPMKTFFKIIMPLSIPALGVISLFAFTTAWNEYIIARAILTKKDLITLPVGLVNLMGQFNTHWGVYSASAILTSIPVMIFFMLMSKFMVSGLTLGGVKG